MKKDSKSEKYILTAEGFDWAIEEFEMLAGILGDPEQYDAVAENLSILAYTLEEYENVHQELTGTLLELAESFSEAYDRYLRLTEAEGDAKLIIDEVDALLSNLKDEFNDDEDA